MDESARAISVPLVDPFDPALTKLQLGNEDFDQAMTEALTKLGDTATPDEVANAYSDRWTASNQAADEVFNHEDCFSQWERERAARIRNAPDSVTSVIMPEPAQCADGWPSLSIGRQGACSHHGGVAPTRLWAVLNF